MFLKNVIWLLLIVNDSTKMIKAADFLGINIPTGSLGLPSLSLTDPSEPSEESIHPDIRQDANLPTVS